MTARQHSKFLKRTSALKHIAIMRATKFHKAIDFTLDDLRDMAQKAIGEMCLGRCGAKLTITNLSLDHSVPLSREPEGSYMPGLGCLWNISMDFCKGCNKLKGDFTRQEFKIFSITSRSCQSSFARTSGSE
jgi:hypothetical protein